jgi:hypothetical protein
MEEKVGTSGRFALPAPLELMACGLLKARQLPADTLQSFPDGLDERFEREKAFLLGGAHRGSHRVEDVMSSALIRIRLTLLPGPM